MEPMLTSDHDMIVSMHTTLQRMDKVLFGNGREGLIETVAGQEVKIAEVRSDLEKFVEKKVEDAKQENVTVVAQAKEDLKRETPGKGGQRYAQITATVAVLVAVIQGVVTALKS